MKTEWSDRPEYLSRSSRKNSIGVWLIPGILGTFVSLAVLNLASSAFLQGTVHKLADKQRVTNSTPSAEVNQPEKATAKDWRVIVEKRVKRDQKALEITQPAKQVVTTPTEKQNVFNDTNYMPRGADNVVSFAEPPSIAEEQKPAGKIRVTVIEQTPSMKDKACWPFKEGSIERRGCRTSIGLNYRD